MEDIRSPVECYGYQGGLNFSKRVSPSSWEQHPEPYPVQIESDDSQSTDSEEKAMNAGFLSDSAFAVDCVVSAREEFRLKIRKRENSGSTLKRREDSTEEQVTPLKHQSPNSSSSLPKRSPFAPSSAVNLARGTTFSAKYAESIKTKVLSMSTPVSAEKTADPSMLLATPYSPFLEVSSTGFGSSRRRRSNSSRRFRRVPEVNVIPPSPPFTSVFSSTRVATYEKYIWSPLSHSTLERSVSNSQYVADLSFLSMSELSYSQSPTWEPTYEERAREALELLYKRRNQ